MGTPKTRDSITLMELHSTPTTVAYIFLIQATTRFERLTDKVKNFNAHAYTYIQLGFVTTFVGRDPQKDTKFTAPHDLAFYHKENVLFVTDDGNSNTIRRITMDGSVVPIFIAALN